MYKRKLFITLLLGTMLTACSMPISGDETDVGMTDEPLPTDTQTIDEISVPTATMTETAMPVATRTASPTSEQPEIRLPTPTSTSVSLRNIEGEQVPPYVVQPGSPVVAPNFVESDLGCNFLGVGGQVFDIDGEPVKGLVVETQGALGGEDVLELSLTGSAPNLGPGGFVIQLSDRLYDLKGNSLSESIPFPTYSECSKNLILINFMEISTNQFINEITLPLILNRQIPIGSLP